MKAQNGLSIAFYVCQFFFGGWFLFHGLNYWTHFYDDPTIRPGPGLLPALEVSGLLAVVKAIEVLAAVLLLCDKFVPLAAVIALPISIVIAFVNSSHHTVFGICVGIIIIVLNATIALGHLDRYRPMLCADAGRPTFSKRLVAPATATQGLASARLGVGWHLLAVVLGIAAATAITFATVHPR